MSFISVSEYVYEESELECCCKDCRHLLRDFDDSDTWVCICRNPQSQHYKENFVNSKYPGECRHFEDKDDI